MTVVLSIVKGPDKWHATGIVIRWAMDSGSAHQEPRPNQTNYMYVRVTNAGDEPTSGCPAGMPTGAFAPGKVMEPGSGADITATPWFTRATGLAPGAATRVAVAQVGGLPQVSVSPAAGGAPLVRYGPFQAGESYGWGYSPNGRSFVMARSGADANARIRVVNGTGAGIEQLAFLGAPAVAPNGAFSPDGEAFIFRSGGAVPEVFLYNLHSATPVLVVPRESATTWERFLFSPFGDLCIFVPFATGGSMKFVKLPSFHSNPVAYTPTYNGNTSAGIITRSSASAPGATSAAAVRNGITLTNMSRPAIDNPACNVPGAQVKGYLADPSTAITRATATPITPGALVAVPAGGTFQAYVGPLPPRPTGHACVLAEVGTLDGRDPIPRRRRCRRWHWCRGRPW